MLPSRLSVHPILKEDTGSFSVIFDMRLFFTLELQGVLRQLGRKALIRISHRTAGYRLDPLAESNSWLIFESDAHPPGDSH